MSRICLCLRISCTVPAALGISSTANRLASSSQWVTSESCTSGSVTPGTAMTETSSLSKNAWIPVRCPVPLSTPMKSAAAMPSTFPLLPPAKSTDTAALPPLSGRMNTGMQVPFSVPPAAVHNLLPDSNTVLKKMPPLAF